MVLQEDRPDNAQCRFSEQFEPFVQSLLAEPVQVAVAAGDACGRRTAVRQAAGRQDAERRIALI
jgi:hypothetical protein